MALRAEVVAVAAVSAAVPVPGVPFLERSCSSALEQLAHVRERSRLPARPRVLVHGRLHLAVYRSQGGSGTAESKTAAIPTGQLVVFGFEEIYLGDGDWQRLVETCFAVDTRLPVRRVADGLEGIYCNDGGQPQ